MFPSGWQEASPARKTSAAFHRSLFQCQLTVKQYRTLSPTVMSGIIPRKGRFSVTDETSSRNHVDDVRGYAAG
ncbi:hypothetical protein KCP71_21095 [Salmonella enterica subsp. enterica]|nr:hypothetical protein KCP71_21095 [Salmonella enterica subsp. enterica]